MVYYEWTERLSVGIPSIDRQHKTLIGYINSLAELAYGNHGQSSTMMEFILDKLMAYTKQHFIYEEMLFDRYGYQEAPEHKDHHAMLAAQVNEYYVRFKSGGGDGSFSKELLEFLMGWLNRHILIDDVAYSAFLLAQGCK